MVIYTNAEMADMHFVYGLANGNSYEARRIYQQKYPRRLVPCAETFTNIHRRLAETGTFERNKNTLGRPQTIRTPELEEAVLQLIDEHPETSTRKIGVTVNASHQTILRILHDQQLYPFHIQRVQALLPRDFPQRLVLCDWFRQKITQNEQFLSYILFTDEANFSRHGIMNFHNNHLWSEENPHAIREMHFQEQFSVNVWAGIINNYLIGPFFLPVRLNGASYRLFLENELPGLLEEIPLLIRNEVWFMHDGAPAHFSIQARQFLNRTYPNRWIGRGVEVPNQPWPPRSPDLNPLDFFLWGHLKSLVYTTPIQHLEDLRNRIIVGCETIRNTPGLLQRVSMQLNRRIEACILADGGHFQQFL